ncbi:CDGSH iron-sulfur domain-containing protein [Streptomyces ovatisporus]|uniref:CDGSH iron-sulfur domain-containing protein n=1 Tax=Streptomyces ovatisporus TaxID=1128682 RepID=A0ABV9ADX7_9ACTN
MAGARQTGRAGDGERPARRVVIDPAGPVLVEGPVEVDLGDGRTVTSDRFMVALCACRRSRSHPWCDTSHRRRSRPAREQTARTETGTEPGTETGAEPDGG